MAIHRLERREEADAGAESGQSLAEYGLILGLVAAAVVVALQTFGSAVANSQGFKLFDLI